MKYVLASSSPRRKALFATICKEFESMHAPEPKGMIRDGSKYWQIGRHAKPNWMIRKGEAKKITKHLAIFKAQWGALRNLGKKVVGADTLIEFEGKIIGKPKNAKEAREILRALSGKEFAVFTGVCVAYFEGKGKIKIKAWSERAKVSFRKIGKSEISAYIKSKKWIGKAGGFNVAKMPACKWVKKVHGDVNTVIGLPLEKLRKEIKKENIFALLKLFFLFFHFF